MEYRGDPSLPPLHAVVALPVSATSTNPPADGLVEVRIGVASLPYLADHGFHEMAVLPGSFSIELARDIHGELFKKRPATLRNIRFESPVILTGDDTAITVRIRDHGGPRIEYTFYEALADEVTQAPDQPHFARLEIDTESEASGNVGSTGFSIEEFKERAGATTSSESFYQALRENGNHYGPQFQNLSAIWTRDDQALGKLNVRRIQTQAGLSGLHPAMLDSITQLLPALTVGKGKTFILRSVERIEISDLNFPDTLWAHATLHTAVKEDTTGYVGDVHVFDEERRSYLEFFGVAFTFLDSAKAAHQTSICIASTFTAEPLEDSLKFWGDHFGASVSVQFAPYNQVFQQLLDPESAFRRNRNGINVIVLSPQDWVEKDQRPLLKANPERTAVIFGNHSRCVLPNGLEIVHLNRYETDYVYREIFDDQCYLRHGIHLKNGDTVVDIGANIGLFSLFVMSRCERATIYAFEPSPTVFELLEANCKAYGGNVHTFNCGVSDRAGTAQFTFYENSSVFSGFYPDEIEDREAVESVVRNVLKREMPAENESLEGYVGELTAERLSRKTSDCALTSVSDIIRDNGIGRIHLLKIDAEKSELDVIKGIEDRYWPIIDQIVIEIHDKTRAAVAWIEDILTQKGYRCAVVEEKLLEDSGLFNIYATRHEAHKKIDAARTAENGLKRRMDEFGAALNSFASYSAEPLILAVVMTKPTMSYDAGLNRLMADVEQELQFKAEQIPNVHFIGSASMMGRYPASQFYDPHSHELGHVSYTPEGYAAIGTTLFRVIFSLSITPLKVIVLDCDNTLWKGVCGEDGPLGIELTPAHRILQQLMVEQMNSGLLICLCSKNREQDVLDVFDRRKDMTLRREHLAAWRMNWHRKSGNIHSLANELHVGLDSFIFIDDDPVECNEVRGHCPEVLVLQLPQEPKRIPSFLDNIWTLDRRVSTQEDRQRTNWYQANVEREHVGRNLFLKNFLDDLQLRVEVTEAAEDQLGRVSQLTFKTNQFNFTTTRRSESEMTSLLKNTNSRCLVTTVSDRFGEYGLVGVLLYNVEKDQYNVDTFLLSCRALGKGVEYRMLSELGRRAELEGKRSITISYAPTERNRPAFEFIHRIGEKHKRNIDGRLLFTIPTQELTGLRYEPNETNALPDDSATFPQSIDARASKTFVSLSDRIQKIADELHDVDQISTAIEAFRLRTAPSAIAEPAPPANTLEAALTTIWKKVLGRTQIGINENFLDVGGTSLKAVMVVATIKRELKRDLSIINLFECPTIRLLAAKLATAFSSSANAGGTDGAEMRGRQRRHKLIKRRTG